MVQSAANLVDECLSVAKDDYEWSGRSRSRDARSLAGSDTLVAARHAGGQLGAA